MASSKKSTVIKIAEKVGEIAGKAMNTKDRIIKKADGAIESVKKTVSSIRGKKKPVKKAAKKVARKTAKAAKKVARVAKRKAAGVKRTVKKAVKKATK